MQGLMVKWYCHTVRMQTAKYKRFHSSAVCSTATAESGKQRNFRTIPFSTHQVAKVSRRATSILIHGKLGTESRFWAFVGIQSAKIALCNGAAKFIDLRLLFRLGVVY